MDPMRYTTHNPLVPQGGHATGLALAFRCPLDPSWPNAAGATKGGGTEAAGPKRTVETKGRKVNRHLELSRVGVFFLFVLFVNVSLLVQVYFCWGCKNYEVFFLKITYGGGKSHNMANASGLKNNLYQLCPEWTSEGRSFTRLY